MKSEEDVREEVEKRLGRDVRDAVWGQFAEKMGRVEAVLDVLDEGDPDRLEEALEVLAEDIRLFEREFRTRSPRPVVEQPDPKPDPRLQSLAFILAAEAAKTREVFEYRQEVLRGKQVEKVMPWLERAARKQGDPIRRITMSLDEAGKRMPTGRVLEAVAAEGFPGAWGNNLTGKVPKPVLDQLDAGDVEGCPRGQRDMGKLISLQIGHKDPGRHGAAWSMETETLEVTGQPLVPVSSHGPLARLKVLSAYLAKALGLSASDWALFVLSGTPPNPVTASRTVRIGPIPPLDRVVIDVSPVVDGRTVLKLYADAKKSVTEYENVNLRTKYNFEKGPTEKHLCLAPFVIWINDGRSWGEAMKEWNEQYPQYSYSNAVQFGWDSRQAYQRITGRELRWKRRRGNKTRR